jgi:hypothetical protein
LVPVAPDNWPVSTSGASLVSEFGEPDIKRRGTAYVHGGDEGVERLEWRCKDGLITITVRDDPQLRELKDRNDRGLRGVPGHPESWIGVTLEEIEDSDN